MVLFSTRFNCWTIHQLLYVKSLLFFCSICECSISAAPPFRKIKHFIARDNNYLFLLEICIHERMWSNRHFYKICAYTWADFIFRKANAISAAWSSIVYCLILFNILCVETFNETFSIDFSETQLPCLSVFAHFEKQIYKMWRKMCSNGSLGKNIAN